MKKVRGIPSAAAVSSNRPAVLCREVERLLPPPREAVRTHANASYGREEFRKGPEAVYRTKEYDLRLNLRVPSAHLDCLKRDSQTVHRLNLIRRWIFNTAHFRRGWVYVPGFLMRGEAGFYVLTGHLECGLGQAVKAAARGGLQRISDFGFLYSARKALFLDPAIEACKYFSLSLLRCGLRGVSKKSPPAVKKPRITFLWVQEWNRESSEVKMVTSAQGKTRLDALNGRAYEYFFPEQRAFLHRRYNDLFSKTIFAEWLLGSGRGQNALALKRFIRKMER